ncbi:cation:proton antiporter [Marivirga arenosa]|uniref:Sodium:proton antiporter n=1 Tax=Marivirga arenosa TaxID=3059076 RepID=A0AA49GEM6_9BACT|nr:MULTISPECIES: sodium:proton antiporter [unclassified Marivirga]WKK80702.2 sodium:proton antiporter [Marivirga sp. BKB1-2]WMN06760.1 sodium:proton antiporter [Marivirga sp. ABR2-2]
MNIFQIITLLIVISALFSYLNVRFFKLPTTIGLMIMAMLFTLGITISSFFTDVLLNNAVEIISSIDFKEVLLDVMLSFLLFAGALHTKLSHIKTQRYPILMFATFGVLVSTILIGSLTFYLLNFMNLPISFMQALLFGALISPTDPIAVLGILKKAGAPKRLETKIVGESLFNDGVGVVIFLVLFQLAANPEADISIGHISFLFFEEVGGGILLGLGLGYATYWMLKSIDNYETEVMLTLAMVMGGYLLASSLHFSGPLAMVVAGLFLGNDTQRQSSMSEITERYVDKFWEILDVFLNAILFVLIGLEVLILSFEDNYIIAGLILIPISLICRYLALLGPIQIFKKKLDFVPRTGLIMTWGGLRGGISIALALSLTDEMNRELIVAITYIIVVFSIIVQGLTVEKVLKWLKVS